VHKARNIALTTVILSVCLLAGHRSFAAQVAVIAHRSVQAEDVDKDLLFEIYKGDVRTWDDDTKIKVWDLSERGEVRDSFYEFLGKRPSRMKSIWMRKLLTGEGEPPEVSESQEKMIENVIATTGSIGYVDKELVDDRVKLLLVIEEE
jgi:ABC-type phosphate transport system substrate-binding protein